MSAQVNDDSQCKLVSHYVPGKANYSLFKFYDENVDTSQPHGEFYQTVALYSDKLYFCVFEHYADIPRGFIYRLESTEDGIAKVKQFGEAHNGGWCGGTRAHTDETNKEIISELQKWYMRVIFEEQQEPVTTDNAFEESIHLVMRSVFPDRTPLNASIHFIGTIARNVTDRLASELHQLTTKGKPEQLQAISKVIVGELAPVAQVVAEKALTKYEDASKLDKPEQTETDPKRRKVDEPEKQKDETTGLLLHQPSVAALISKHFAPTKEEEILVTSVAEYVIAEIWELSIYLLSELCCFPVKEIANVTPTPYIIRAALERDQELAASFKGHLPADPKGDEYFPREIQIVTSDGQIWVCPDEEQ